MEASSLQWGRCSSRLWLGFRVRDKVSTRLWFCLVCGIVTVFFIRDVPQLRVILVFFEIARHRKLIHGDTVSAEETMELRFLRPSLWSHERHENWKARPWKLQQTLHLELYCRWYCRLHCRSHYSLRYKLHRIRSRRKYRRRHHWLQLTQWNLNSILFKFKKRRTI